MGKAVRANKNSNVAMMNAAVKYFSWNMKKCFLSRSKRAGSRNGNERCGSEIYRRSTQNRQGYRFGGFKKTKNFPTPVNENFLETLKSGESAQIEVYIELDEMWSFCHDKSNRFNLKHSLKNVPNYLKYYNFYFKIMSVGLFQWKVQRCTVLNEILTVNCINKIVMFY